MQQTKCHNDVSFVLFSLILFP